MIEPISPSQTSSISQRVGICFQTSLPVAFKTIKWLLKLMLPVSFFVMLLDYSGILFLLASYTEPFVHLLGLRGEAALVLLSGALLNIYSAIAVMQSIHFTPREITIVALMVLIAHNLIVETAVQKKTGSSAIKMVLLRIGVAMVAGFLLNLILPLRTVFSEGSSLIRQSEPFVNVFTDWLISTFYLIVKVVLILIGLNFLHKILDEFAINTWLARFMSPLLRMFGLPPKASFLWIIANVIGLAWGSSVLIEETRQGKITQQEADILNHHVAISHSLLEDTLLFIAIGASLFWIVFPRLLLAFLVVWIYRLVFLKHQTFTKHQ
jgi:hypothetical protein